MTRATKTKPTVGSIIQHVEKLLSTTRGLDKIKQLNGHFTRLEQCSDELLDLRRRIRPRPMATFYVSVSAAKATKLEIDVRIRGVSCGVVEIAPRRKRRTFKPKGKHCEYFPRNSAPWESDKVRQYLEDLRSCIPRGAREAEVESLLLLEMSKGAKSEGKPDRLLWHQPVKLAKLPFQFPLPIGPRKELQIAGGSSAGHADVIARARTASRQRVRIFEVKKAAADDIGHALDQAVAYCAALDHLVVHYPEIYFSALGFSHPRKTLRLDAVAFVPNSKTNRHLIQVAANRLLDGGSRFGLCGMFFSYEDGVLGVDEEVRYL